jgi:hypothetical protein
MSLDEKKAARLRFLKHLCERPGADLQDVAEVGKEVGLDREQSEDVGRFLQQEALIAGVFHSQGGAVRATPRGFAEVERALRNRNQETRHFPAAHVIKIGIMNNSAIQQGSPGAARELRLDQSKRQELDDLLEVIHESNLRLSLAEDKQKKLEADIETIKVHLASPNAKPSIVQLSLESMVGILQGVAAAAEILPRLRTLIGHF